MEPTIFNLHSSTLFVRIRFTDLKKGNFEEDYTVANFFSHPKFDKVPFLYYVSTFSSFLDPSSLLMAIRVVKFISRQYKIKRFLLKNQHTQRKLLNFEN